MITKEAEEHLLRQVSMTWGQGRADLDESGPWDKTASHYTVTLTRYGRPAPALVLGYSMGSAHKSPKKKDVLHCVWMDSQYAAHTEEELMAEFGEDPDSRKAYASAKRTIKAARKNKAWIDQAFSAEEQAQLEEMFEDY